MIKFTFTYEDDTNKVTKEMKFPHLDEDDFSLSNAICEAGYAPFDVMYDAMRGVGFSDSVLARAMARYALDNLLTYCSTEESTRIFSEIKEEFKEEFDFEEEKGE